MRVVFACCFELIAGDLRLSESQGRAVAEPMLCGSNACSCATVFSETCCSVKKLWNGRHHASRSCHKTIVIAGCILLSQGAGSASFGA
jgi:hypothetical protein